MYRFVDSRTEKNTGSEPDPSSLFHDKEGPCTSWSDKVIIEMDQYQHHIFLQGFLLDQLIELLLYIPPCGGFSIPRIPSLQVMWEKFAQSYMKKSTWLIRCYLNTLMCVVALQRMLLAFVIRKGLFLFWYGTVAHKYIFAQKILNGLALGIDILGVMADQTNRAMDP